MKQLVKAKYDIVLSYTVIPKGTIGWISRISPRLKKSYVYENCIHQTDKTSICLKFPKTRSFFGNITEIEFF